MDTQHASKLAQRAGLGRLVALSINEHLVNITYSIKEGQYLLTPLDDKRLEMLKIAGKVPMAAAADAPKTDGFVVPALLIESDVVLGSYTYLRKEKAEDEWQVVDADVQPDAFIQILRQWNDWDEALTGGFAARLRNSNKHLTDAYMRQRPCPTLDSTFIQWEQAVIEGNMHPLHKCRMPMAKTHSTHLTIDFLKPEIAFVVAARDQLSVFGDLEAQLKPLLSAAGVDPSEAKEGEIILPVHEFQVEPLLASEKAEGRIRVLPQRITGLAQSSTRTITIPAVPGISVKLGLAMIISDTNRLLSHGSVASAVQLGTSDSLSASNLRGLRESGLEIIPEVAGVIGYDEQIGVLIRREDFSARAAAGLEPDVTYLMAGVLGEPATSGSVERVAETVFGLTTRVARQDFFREYTRLFLGSVLPPFLVNGLAFYLQGQNSLLKVSKSSKKLLGFAVRDLGDTRVHKPTYEATTGLKVTNDRIWDKSLTDLRVLLFRIGRTWFTVHLIALMNGLRLDERDPQLADTKPEDVVNGATIIAQELDQILRKYEDDFNSTEHASTDENVAQVARETWLESPTWPTQAFVSQRMRSDWSHRAFADQDSRIDMHNMLHTGNLAL